MRSWALILHWNWFSLQDWGLHFLTPCSKPSALTGSRGTENQYLALMALWLRHDSGWTLLQPEITIATAQVIGCKSGKLSFVTHGELSELNSVKSKEDCKLPVHGMGELAEHFPTLNGGSVTHLMHLALLRKITPPLFFLKFSLMNAAARALYGTLVFAYPFLLAPGRFLFWAP